MFAVGVQYMRNNPERFIESSIDHSWLRFLIYKTHQGTWADALVIQAVADALNVALHIGHLEEMHYVPTVPFPRFLSTNQPLKKQHNQITSTQKALLTH